MHYIIIETPKEIKSNRVKIEIEKLYKGGLKMNEIGLQMNFICDNPDAIRKTFQVIKNHIAFNIKKI